MVCIHFVFQAFPCRISKCMGIMPSTSVCIFLLAWLAAAPHEVRKRKWMYIATFHARRAIEDSCAPVRGGKQVC